MIFKVKKTSEIDLNTSFKVEKSPSFKTENSKNLAQKVQCLKSILFIYPQVTVYLIYMIIITSIHSKIHYFGYHYKVRYLNIIK